MGCKIGQKAEVYKSFNQDDVLNYIRCSGDNNPIHYDIDYADKSIFHGRIVPGLQVASLFGGLLGSKLPGEGTIHLGQTLSFKEPVFIGEMVKAEIEVMHIRQDKPIITFKTTCYKANSDIAVTGEAVVKLM